MKSLRLMPIDGNKLPKEARYGPMIADSLRDSGYANWGEIKRIQREGGKQIEIRVRSALTSRERAKIRRSITDNVWNVKAHPHGWEDHPDSEV